MPSWKNLNTSSFFKSLSFLLLGFLSNCELLKPMPAPGGPTPGPTVSDSELRRQNAMQVLTTHCMSCHASRGDMSSVDSSDHAWATSGLVESGNVEASRLLQRLRNTNDGYTFTWGASADRTMPQGTNRMTKADVEKLIVWIEKMEEESGGDDENPPPPPPPPPPPVVTDPELPSITPDPTRIYSATAESRVGAERFYDAMVVVKAKCMSCHADAAKSGGEVFPTGANFKNEASWRALTAYVTPGNAAASGLFARLKRATDDGTVNANNSIRQRNGDMPLGTATLTVQEIAAIKDWIDMMNSPGDQLIIIRTGQGNKAWNSADKALRAKVASKIRVRNLDTTLQHSVHTNNNKPFAHGNTNNPAIIGFGGEQNFTFATSADSTNGADQIYDHVQGTGARIFMVITP